MTAVASPVTSGYRGHLGISVTHASRERVIGQMLIDGALLNDLGAAHGGALMSFADELGARGVVAALPPGHVTSTIESKTNFFRRCPPGLIRGESIPLHAGRTTMVWQTTITDAGGQTVAIITQTQIVLPAEPLREPPKVVTPTLAAPAVSSTSAAEARRADIIRAATKVMGSKGFANATMKEIAAEAGMHVPTMYQYVRSKDELLYLICDDWFELMNQLHDKTVAGGGTAAERLARSMRALIVASETHRTAIRLIVRETPLLQPGIRLRSHARWISFVQRFVEIIEEGVRDGEFDPIEAHVAAHMIQALCEMWAIRRVLLNRHGLETIERTILQLVLKGLARGEKA